MVSSAAVGTGIAVASDLANLGFGVYDRMQGRDSGSAGDDARFMNDFAWKQSLRNEEYQKNYLQYRSADAIAAGLHPLAALGVNVGSGPSAAAFSGVIPKSNPYSDMSNLGQNTSRALLAQATAQERMLAEATVQKLGAETRQANSLASYYDRMPNTTGTPPALPEMDRNQKYQLVWDPMSKKYEYILSSQASQGIMSDPIKMWSESIKNFVLPQDSGEIRKFMFKPWYVIDKFNEWRGR